MKHIATRDMAKHPRKNWISFDVYDDDGVAFIRRVEKHKTFEWHCPGKTGEQWAANYRRLSPVE